MRAEMWLEHRRPAVGEGQVAEFDLARRIGARRGLAADAGADLTGPLDGSSLIAGSVSSTSSIRFHDAMPRCSMLVTQPNAIIGQLSIVR